MTGLQIVLVGILSVCVGASGFFSGSETAIFALPRERATQLSERGTRGKRLAALVADTDATLGTLLIANNFVNILGASVATTLAIDFVGAVMGRSSGEALGPWISTLVVTAVILVVGEITPKTLASRRPEQFGLFVAPTIWWLGKVLDPVAKVFVGISRRILRLVGVNADSVSVATEQDIMALAAMSHEAGEIDAAEREILESLFALADRPVRDVMTPRLEVIALQAGDAEKTARQAVTIHAHSRFPVVKTGGTLDDVVGILYMKDMVRQPSDGKIDRFLREPVFVPESTPVLYALQQLRRQKISFGVVVDEHGGVEGIVTVKDLIAELVGEIQDEYDPKEPTIIDMGDDQWVVEGRVPVEDLELALGCDLPDGPYSSVGGLYLAFAGRIPSAGEEIEIDGFVFRVIRMDRRRIDRLQVTATAPLGPIDGGQI
ncbi:MAG TPA: hemolysin family protein [Acidimicrobiia bacterium]